MKKLILLAGQSNMSGRGYAMPEDLLPIDNVKVLARDYTWREAIEPITKDRSFVGTFAADGKKHVSPDPWDTILPEAGEQVVGVGPGRTFARLLHELHPDWEIGIIPASVGGTPLSAWVPGGPDPYETNRNPYDECKKFVEFAQKEGEIVAVLWHQGESDASRKTPDYKGKLREIILNFRKDFSLADNVPFIMGTLASFYGEHYPQITSGQAEVDTAMVELTAEIPYVGLVCANDLDHRGDHLHFSSEAQHILGERYFRMWKSMTAVTPEKAEMQMKKYESAKRLKTSVLLDPGEFLVTSEFGYRTHPVTGEKESFHSGIDGALWNGRMLLETFICACADGIVTKAFDDDSLAGTHVEIDHGDGLVSRYLHMEKGSLKVKNGDAVKCGTVLGYMGKTGRATGEHLHFEVLQNGNPIDPLPLMSK